MGTSNDPFAGSGFESTPAKTEQPSPPEPPAPVPAIAPQPQVSSDPFAGSGFETDNKLSNSYRKVMDSDASKNAQVLKLSTQSGLEPSKVAQDPEAIQKAISAPTPEYLDTLKEHSPVTSEWLGAQQVNLAATHDDIPANVKHESVFADLQKSVAQANADLLKYAILGSPLESGGLGPWHYGPEDVRALADDMQSRADAISSPDLNQDAIHEALSGNMKPLEAQIASSIPNLIKMAATFGANPVVGGYDIFSETAGKSYEKSREAGLSSSEASASAITKGAVATGTTFLVFGLLGKLYKPLANQLGQTTAKQLMKNAIKAKLAADAAFVGQSQAQLLANAITDKITGENPKAFDDYGKKAVDDGALSFIQSQIVTLPGLGIVGLAKTPEGIKPTTETNPGEALQVYHEQTAKAGKEFFLKAFDTAKSRKLSTDNPFQAKEIDDALGKQYGAQEVHIPVEQFQEMYQDKASEMADKMGPDFKKSFDDAQTTGGTVHGPLSDLLTNKNDIKPAELADHVKLKADSKTVYEAAEGKKELEVAKTKAESDHKKALDDFQKQIEEGIKGIGGEAGKGAQTQAKGIARVFENLSKTINVPLDKLAQLYKFNILKEQSPKDEFNALYEQAHGMVSPSDYVKKYGIKLLVEKPDETTLSGGALAEAKLKWQQRVKDAEGQGFKVTSDPKAKGASSPSGLAQDLFDAANSGELNPRSLPEEWWDDAKSGRPDANHDNILEIVRNGGSGVETIQKLNNAMQEHQQGGMDPFGLSPEDQKSIFGNEIPKKESAVDKVFNDKTLKPNLDAKQQDMFGAKEIRPQGPQQEMFQSSATWDSLVRSGDWGKYRAKEQEVMAMKPAVIDAKTGQVWTADSHAEAVSKAQDEGNKRVGFESTGFVTKDGKFLTRKEAEKQYGFKDTDGLRGSQEFFQSGEASREFNQGHRGRVIISGLAGEPQGRTFDVYVGQGADKSTLFHEFAHNFLQIFRDHVGQENATPEAKAIEAKLLDWFGVKDWKDVGDRHSEMFARGFEYRLWEGKSPSGLDAVFNKFAEWMRKIYPSSQVMDKYLKSVGAKMTDEMRGVYDRFIASSEEIEKAEKEMGYRSEAPEGLSEEELAEWKSKQDAATQEAMGRLNTIKMKALTKEAEHQIGMERHAASEKANKEVNELPIFKAKDEFENLISGFEGKSKEIAERYLNGEADNIEKDAMQRVALENGFNNGPELAYGLANCDRAKEVQDRIDAHMAEFIPKIKGSPAEAQMAILGGEKRSDALAYEAAQLKQLMGIVSELKGNALKGEMEKAQGKKAVTSMTEKKLEPMTKEEANLKRQVVLKQYRQDKANAKVQATQIMDGLKLKDARAVRSFVSDMTNAAKRAKTFADEGKVDKAREWKLKQLLNHELSMKAVQNKTIIAKDIKGLQKMGKIEKKPLAMPFGHWAQIKNILEGFGMKEPKAIQEYVFKKMATDMLANGKTNDQIAEATGFTFNEDGTPAPESLQQFKDRIGNTGKIEDRDEQLASRINLPEKMNLNEMTIRDLRNIKNSVDAIYKHGRDEKEIEVDGKKLSIDIKAGEFVKAITQNVGTPHEADILNKSFKQKVIDLLTHLDDYFLPELNHIETVAELIDGAKINPETGKIQGGKEGPAHDLLTNPLRDAQAKEREIIRGTVNAQKELYNKHYPTDEAKDELKKEVAVKTSKGIETFTRTEARNLVALASSKEGRDRLMSGNKWTGEDFIKIANILKKEDVEYLKGRAKIDEENWPKIVALEMELHNREIKPCEKIPIETPYGVINGMYHPIAYDYTKGRTLQQAIMGDKTEDEIKRASRFVPLSYDAESGFTKSRVAHLERPVRLDDGVYQQYLADTDHYLSHQRALMNVNKALRHPDIQKALANAFGERGASLFATQTKYIANGSPGASGILEKAFQWSRISDILYNIGMRPQLFFVKRAQDVINLADEMGGYKNYLKMQDDKGMTIFSDKFRELMQDVDSKSSQMRDRGENFDYNVRAIHEAFSNEKGLLDWYRNNAYLPEKLADRRVAYLSWKYIETKALAEGKNDQVARRQADAFVEQILGGGSPLQHIGVMRGNEFLKSFSPAFTFFSSQYQRMWLKGRLAKQMYEANNPLLANKVIAGALARFVLTPALVVAGSVELIKHHDKEPVGDRAGRLGEEVFSQTLGLLPGGRNIAGMITHKFHQGSASFFPIENLTGKVLDGFKALFKGIKEPGKFTEKDAQNMVDVATELSRAPRFLENEIINLYDDIMRNGSKDWIDYVFGKKHTAPKGHSVKPGHAR